MLREDRWQAWKDANLQLLIRGHAGKNTNTNGAPLA
jgi:hypothetical protein